MSPRVRIVKPENVERSYRAFEVIQRYASADGPSETPDEALTDLLSDLMHFCDTAGMDFAARLRTAMDHYVAEGGYLPQFERTLDGLDAALAEYKRHFRT